MRPLVIAHRGNSAHETENTVAAFESAWRAGADGVETDVRLTRDGQCVLHHDPETHRGERIGAMTFAEIERRYGSLVPSLFSLLTTTTRHPWRQSRLVLFELKLDDPSVDMEVLARTCVRSIAMYVEMTEGRAIPIHAVVTSNDYHIANVVDHLVRHRGLSFVQPGFTIYNRRDIAEATRWHHEHCNATVSIPYQWPMLVDMFGDESLAYTVNDPRRATVLFRCGVGGIITDDVPAMITARDTWLKK